MNDWTFSVKGSIGIHVAVTVRAASETLAALRVEQYVRDQLNVHLVDGQDEGIRIEEEVDVMTMDISASKVLVGFACAEDKVEVQHKQDEATMGAIPSPLSFDDIPTSFVSKEAVQSTKTPNHVALDRAQNAPPGSIIVAAEMHDGNKAGLGSCSCFDLDGLSIWNRLRLVGALLDETSRIIMPIVERMDPQQFSDLLEKMRMDDWPMEAVVGYIAEDYKKHAKPGKGKMVDWQDVRDSDGAGPELGDPTPS